MRIIAGTARSRVIEAPKGRDTRPTLDRVRENLFNILQKRIWDARVLDLFAGSGALSMEAVSRGARSAVLVDHDRAAHLAEKRNAEALGFAERTVIWQCDWQRAVCRLREEGARFDLVFLDPPYAMNDLSGVTGQLKPLLAPGALVIVEHVANQPARVADGYMLTDGRKYGYVGISMYALSDEEAKGHGTGVHLSGQL